MSRATHGEPGGVSAAGLLAGAAAALSARGLARAASVGVVPGAWTVAGAGFGAAVVESGVAGTAWGRRLGPIGRNVLLSLLAAAAGCALAGAAGSGA